MQPATETDQLDRNQTSDHTTFSKDFALSGGALIVLTAPLTESIDHAGYLHPDGVWPRYPSGWSLF